MLMAIFAIANLFFSYKNCILIWEANSHTRNITCIAFPDLTVQTKPSKFLNMMKL